MNSLVAAALALGVAAGTRAVADERPRVGSAVYTRFAVAADHALASEAGAEVLRAGGNAVDAAVATSFALSVVRPFSCGIGGGGFMVIWIGEAAARPGDGGRADGRAVAINYRETAPAGVGRGFFEGLPEEDSRRGGKACAVPGTVAGLLHALEGYGSMDRARVLAPAIRLARGGFAADAAYAAASRGLSARFDEHPEWKGRFAFAWERFLGSGRIEVGDRIVLPEQARVLEAIAERGRDGFYAGEVADAIVVTCRDAGGVMTLEDLAGYRVVELPPLRAELGGGGRVLLTMPPPSSGGVAMAQVFGLLERKGLAERAAKAEWGAYAQLLVEGFKHAFADRATWMGDPAFVDVPVERLLSGPYLDGLSRRIEIGRTRPPETYGSRPAELQEQLPEDGGTSHLCVVDHREGKRMAVACTETINLHFGSLVSSERLGFCLNNEMDDFTTRRGAANAFGLAQSERNMPEPGKRPLSSMSPTIVIGADGRVEAVAGGSGGPRIITATTQVLLNALVRGDDAARAVSRARVHHQWSPNVLEIEKGLEDRQGGLGVEMWMRKLHHKVVESRPAETACVQLIMVRDGKLDAACDPRKGGAPAGE